MIRLLKCTDYRKVNNTCKKPWDWLFVSQHGAINKSDFVMDLPTFMLYFMQYLLKTHYLVIPTSLETLVTIIIHGQLAHGMGDCLESF